VIATAALPGGGTFSLVGDVGPVDQADASLTPLDAIVASTGSISRRPVSSRPSGVAASLT